MLLIYFVLHEFNFKVNYFIYVLIRRSGNVSQGAQEIFQDLPHEYVPPDMLQKVADHGCKFNLQN